MEAALFALRGLELLKVPEIKDEYSFVGTSEYSVVRRVVAWWRWRKSSNRDESRMICHAAFEGLKTIFERKKN